MKLAAVILNYNDAQTTIGAVRRIDGFSCIDHIVIVDNASPDGSAARIAEEFGLKKTEEHVRRSPGITLLKAPRNGGYGYGNNMGVKYAYEKLQADLVLIANPDAVFDEDLVRKMQQVFADEPRTAAVGAVMHEDGAAFTYEEFLLSGWKERTLKEEVLHSGPLCKRFFRKQLDYPESHYRGQDPVPVYAVHGSLLMVSAPAFLGSGGYDPQMFLYMEEYTLAHRLREAGRKTFLLPYGYSHEGSHSITGAGYDAVRRQKLRQKSERQYYRDSLGAGPLQMIPVRIFQEIVLLETRLAAGCRLI